MKIDLSGEQEDNREDEGQETISTSVEDTTEESLSESPEEGEQDSKSKGRQRLLLALLGVFAVLLLVYFGKDRIPIPGLFGGKPGCKSRFLINGVPKDPGGLNFANPGDVIAFSNPGGGGYGNPLEREPEMVERDVINGYVSPEKARKDYGIVINFATMKLDLEATQRLRESMGKNK